jgi:hypothetical protein
MFLSFMIKNLPLVHISTIIASECGILPLKEKQLRASGLKHGSANNALLLSSTPEDA